MPQIGGFEILIIVVIAILVIGPKDFPFVLRKIGSWIGSTKRYFTDIQQSVTKLDESVDEKISIEEKYSEKSKDENKWQKK
jgi:sec-independent protein translocase protein TatB